MPAMKRKSMQGSKRYYKKRKVSGVAKRNLAARRIQAVVRRTLNKNLETKRSNFTSTDGVEISHNNFVTLDSALLKTSPGPFDPTTTDADNRIGDEVMLRGVSLKGMLELNERYSDVTFRILVVRSAKGDTPTRATLFNGLSGNKMLDTLNTERYTILASKFIKIVAPNSGTSGGQVVDAIVGPSGFYNQTTNDNKLSRATKLWKIWIPGSKFSKNGRIRYEQGSSQPKFFDYHCVVYAYSNYSTNQDVWNVGRVNDYIKVMFYKDG